MPAPDTTLLATRRSALLADARRIIDTHPGARFTANVALQFDAVLDEVNRIDSQLSDHAAREANTRARQDTDAIADAIDRRMFGSRRLPVSHPRRIVDTWLRGGDGALLPGQLKNVMSTTTGSEGGFSVPTAVAAAFLSALKPHSAMRRVADVFASEGGGPLNWPITDGTSEVGERLAENVPATNLDPSFASVAVNLHRYSSKIIVAPIELVQDAGIDFVGMVENRCAERIARSANVDFTTGTGTGQPRGVVTASTAGKVGLTGQTSTLIYDDLADLLHSVDSAYRGRARWMLHDTTLRFVRKIKDTSGFPVWSPGYEGDPIDGAPPAPPATLLGYPYTVNPDMPVMAANARSVLFGDFTRYKVRDGMQVTLFRFTDSAYSRAGQVGFLAMARHGGNLVDTAAVKHYANSAT